MTPLSVLERYWNYASFKPLQEEIMASLMAGKDTLALLPTGGGKSLCYQIPGTLSHGIALIISPLVALMKEQVNDLNHRNIRALCITSELSPSDIIQQFDNCLYDPSIKFLYVSPERLQTELFKSRIKQLPLSFIAVDEAHCISQWGYDFRASYLAIGTLRQELGLTQTPIIALTATATERVIADIQVKLLLNKPNLYKQSYRRSNLFLSSIYTDNKLSTLVQSITNILEEAVLVYVTSRKRAEDVAAFLIDNSLNATYFHAGLSADEKTKRQKKWQHNQLQIIVATSAFGMGINKPDVRLVIHYDIPDSLEAYYQEIGRAGRDNNPAQCTLLYNSNDISYVKRRFLENHPSKTDYRTIISGLFNTLQIAKGEITNTIYEVSPTMLAKKWSLSEAKVYYTLRFLHRAKALHFYDKTHYSTLFIEALPANIAHYPLLNFIARHYGGVFSSHIKIDEFFIAKNFRQSVEKIQSALTLFHRQRLVHYHPRDSYKIRWLQPNETFYFQHTLWLLFESLIDQKAKNLANMLKYIETSDCRTSYILHYFGEHSITRCQSCDND